MLLHVEMMDILKYGISGILLLQFIQEMITHIGNIVYFLFFTYIVQTRHLAFLKEIVSAQV